MSQVIPIFFPSNFEWSISVTAAEQIHVYLGANNAIKLIFHKNKL